MDKVILVTGATGYIASRLIPRLLESGYQVRCLVRNPLRLTGRSWFRHVDIFQGDATLPSTLAPALDGVHTAYYLIHNMSSGRGYLARELTCAHNFAVAAEEAGIEQIIYLGGLADPEQRLAPHMRSRIETGEMLRYGKVPVTEFRAGVIMGSGSISFEMLRFMTELFPIVPGPLWMKNKSQPIAIQNVIDYLLSALTNPPARGGIFEIGGPEVTTYADMILCYARVRGLKRRMFLLPGVPVWLMAFGVGLMTPVPRSIAQALIGGLTNDSIVRHNQALRVFKDIRLISMDEATAYALQRTQPALVERIWEDGRPAPKALKHEGFFINYRRMDLNIASENAFHVLRRVINKPRWRVEINEQNQRIVVRERGLRTGDQWIEWKADQYGELICISQTVFFSPRGLPGFLYWLILYPFHIVYMKKLEKSIRAGTTEPSTDDG